MLHSFGDPYVYSACESINREIIDVRRIWPVVGKHASAYMHIDEVLLVLKDCSPSAVFVILPW